MEYKGTNLSIFLITVISLLIGIDGLKIQKTKQQLMSECVIVGQMISSCSGVSNQLIKYLQEKDIQLEYPETNSKNNGDIVEFSLIYECKNIIIQIKEIKTTYYVILGSII